MLITEGMCLVANMTPSASHNRRSSRKHASRQGDQDGILRAKCSVIMVSVTMGTVRRRACRLKRRSAKRAAKNSNSFIRAPPCTSVNNTAAGIMHTQVAPQPPTLASVCTITSEMFHMTRRRCRLELTRAHHCKFRISAWVRQVMHFIWRNLRAGKSPVISSSPGVTMVT